ncbi:hypothetical protein DPMN_032352 [Dreissena polymorpha]|uniref:Uncharacterized protein n=1 Tax=Dreissena polymorpha TaxID=45954 RepID=A0A9D4RHW1_DREPO|nr:hypothetical protein DPMN_032352 [Dreissena polymorpha]
MFQTYSLVLCSMIDVRNAAQYSETPLLQACILGSVQAEASRSRKGLRLRGTNRTCTWWRN